MSNEVQFDIDTQPQAKYRTTTPTFVQLVIKYSGGKIKDEMQANYVLLGFVVLALVVSLFLIFSGGKKPYYPPQQEMLRAITYPSAPIEQ